MKKHPPSSAVMHARRLRKNATDAEREMWGLLKSHFPEVRFRRQVPIRHYIADFASHSAKVVIEIDGGQHGMEKDATRTAAIEAEDYRVIRFWNNDVMNNASGCMTMLGQLLRPEHPQPATTSEQARKSAHPAPIEGEGK